MARQSPYQIVLSTEERRMLTARTAKYTRPYFEVLRAKMILLAAAAAGEPHGVSAQLDMRGRRHLGPVKA
jgi:hypothetical protein